MRHKVLIITYYWLPALGPAVQRWTVFVEELRKSGIEPVILTVKDGTYPAVDSGYSEDASPYKVVRTATREPFRIYNWLRGRSNGSSVGLGDASSGKSLVAKVGNFVRANFFIPDARVGWIPYAVKKAEEIIRDQNIQQIVTTGPPHSTHLIGRKLKKSNPQLFWLADFRDPWVHIYYNRHLLRTSWAWKKDKALETAVLREADLITVISEGMKREFQDRAQEILTIMNGYKETDFPAAPTSKKERNFIVRYTGNFTDNQVVDSIWKAFSNLIEQHPLGQHIRFRLTGNVSQGIRDVLAKYHLSHRVDFEDYCPHEEAVKKMIDADVLLLIIPRAPNNALIITAKIFEYLASGSPILAVGPEGGDAAAVLRASHRSPMIYYEDVQKMQTFIEEQLEKWKAEESSRPKSSRQEHRQFSRNQQAKKLIGALNL